MFASLLLLSSISLGLLADPNLPDPNASDGSRLANFTSKIEQYRRQADIQPQSAQTIEAHRKLAIEYRKLALEYLKLHRKSQTIATCRG